MSGSFASIAITMPPRGVSPRGGAFYPLGGAHKFHGNLFCTGYPAAMGENGGGDMYQRKLERDIRCPLEYGMELFGGKWNSHIICVLAVLGTLRYSELRREMGSITGLPDFFTNKAGVLLEGGDALFVGDAAGYIRLNLAMPRSIIETGLARMAKAVREAQVE